MAEFHNFNDYAETSLGGGPYARVKEINDKSKDNNPLLCYVLEKVRELVINYNIESVELEKGWDSAQADTVVYVDLDAVAKYLADRYIQFREKKKKEALLFYFYRRKK